MRIALKSRHCTTNIIKVCIIIVSGGPRHIANLFYSHTDNRRTSTPASSPRPNWDWTIMSHATMTRRRDTSPRPTASSPNRGRRPRLTGTRTCSTTPSGTATPAGTVLIVALVIRIVIDLVI